MEIKIYIYFAIIAFLNLNVNGRNIMKNNSYFHRENDMHDAFLARKEFRQGSQTALKQADSCECKNGFCERKENGNSICKCPPEWAPYAKNTCKKCDCGKGANCTFVIGIFSDTKNCICKDGYKDVSGTCKDICEPNPCENGGTCGMKYGKLKCFCSDLFTGRNCEIDRCDPNPCENGGTCAVVNGSTTCFCKDSFTGNYCEEDRCDPNPCENGGTCAVVNGSTTCLCKDSFTGNYCEEDASKLDRLSSSVVFTTPRNASSVSDYETPVSEEFNATFSKTFRTTTGTRRREENISFTNWDNETTTEASTVVPDLCYLHHCMNGGICRVVNYRPRCLCFSQFTGKFCEKDPCTTKPCVNGGTCRIQNTTFHCSCSEPFTGDLCERDPCTENPCQNDGTCLMSGYTFKCICKENFTGDKCETRAVNTTYILLLVILSLMIVTFIVLVSYFVFRRKYTSKSKGAGE